jgi:hypothetical protein
MCLPCQSSGAVVTFESPDCHPLPLRRTDTSTPAVRFPLHYFTEVISDLENKTEITVKKRITDMLLLAVLPHQKKKSKSELFGARIVFKRVFCEFTYFVKGFSR